jgi:diguanylate cyclase (GGDEF)-like protein
MPGGLEQENAQLRARLTEAERNTAQTLVRATRLGQVISILGYDLQLRDILERTATEVASLFRADVGLLLLGGDDGLRLEGQCGLARESFPAGPVSLGSLVDGDPVRVGPERDFDLPEWLAPYALMHVARVRLMVGQESLGVLLLGRMAPEPFESTDAQELRAIGYRIALAIENRQLQADMERQIARLRRLHELTTRLTSAVELTDVAATLAATLTDELPASGAGVYVSHGDSLRLLAEEGTDGAHLPEHLYPGHPYRLYTLASGDEPIGAVLLTAPPDPGGELAALLPNVLDVAALALQKALLYEQTREQARRDSLTGLLGHGAFHETLEQSLGEAHPGDELTLAMIDIDDFKRINDTCGHPVGDDALRQVAGAISDNLRAGDTVFRVGGEEFCALLPGGAEGARLVAERLRTAVRDVVCELPVTVSVGLAGYPAHGTDRDTLIERADAALYTAKHAGKDRVAVAGVDVRIDDGATLGGGAHDRRELRLATEMLSAAGLHQAARWLHDESPAPNQPVG